MVNTTSDAGWNFVRLTLGLALGTFAVAATPALGAAQTGPQRPVTFAKDVAPILQRTCQNCHRPGLGGGAPMSLVTYEDVRPWARAIKMKTMQREMPPWFIEKNVGVQQFKEDISLSDEEIDTIARWVDGGAPLGNPADLPPARKFAATQEWTIGTPDLVVTSPEMEVKAIAADWHGFLTPTPVGLTKTRFIKAVEVREVRVREEEVVEKPGQPRAACHWGRVIRYMSQSRPTSVSVPSSRQPTRRKTARMAWFAGSVPASTSWASACSNSQSVSRATASRP